MKKTKAEIQEEQKRLKRIWKDIYYLGCQTEGLDPNIPNLWARFSLNNPYRQVAEVLPTLDD